MQSLEEAIISLRGSLKASEILTPDDENYAQSIKRWSDAAEKNAGLVVYATNAEDVSRTLIWAKRQGLETVVCSAGHSCSGSSSTQGGVVIDLSMMRNVSVSPEKQVIVAQGGCRWEEVDAEAAAHGLATVGGTVNHTGIGGLTLGGGYGWLSGKYGLTIDVVLSMQVVLADGKIVTASAAENPDLFWALRGAGQSFGVVTEFVFKAFPQREKVWSGVLVFTSDKLEGILDFANKVPDASQNGANGVILGLSAPPPLRGDIGIMVAVFHDGSSETGKEYYKPLLELGPLLNTVSEIPYKKLNSILNQPNQYGGRKTMKGFTFITPLSADFLRGVISDLKTFLGKHPDAAETVILLEMYDQRKICSVPHTATAYGNRGMYQNGCVLPQWTKEELDKPIREWTREMARNWQVEMERMKKDGHSIEMEGAGQYGNYDSFGSSAKDIFGPNYDRLVELKTKYDPSNMFSKSIALLPGQFGTTSL
ncbi:hypothetical protein BP6252_06985 [Coleophoma cylindrospora]|uniref:FAD-binding PCMH-type domain-containing protein n=1 Tax=Coleophoma cylindrospora TaxID=1849047 RepID=A0A3D8RGM4_9HELO|nr:hypothetical protein BP6252_06985 [Coleophoma cylindrospora]